MFSKRQQILQRYVEAESESLMNIFNEKVSVVRARISVTRSTTNRDLTRTKKLLKESLTEVGRLKRRLLAVQSEVDIMKSLLPPHKIQEIFLNSCQESDLSSLSLCLRLGVDVMAGLRVCLWSGQLEAVRTLLQSGEVRLVQAQLKEAISAPMCSLEMVELVVTHLPETELDLAHFLVKECATNQAAGDRREQLVKILEFFTHHEGVDWNDVNASGETPIISSIKLRDIQVTALLLKTEVVNKAVLRKEFIREVISESSSQWYDLLIKFLVKKEADKSVFQKIPECPVSTLILLTRCLVLIPLPRSVTINMKSSQTSSNVIRDTSSAASAMGRM